MTINDTEVNERCLKIRQMADGLNLAMREGREGALFRALSDIESAAKQAQWRLNEIKYRE